MSDKNNSEFTENILFKEFPTRDDAAAHRGALRIVCKDNDFQAKYMLENNLLYFAYTDEQAKDEEFSDFAGILKKDGFQKIDVDDINLDAKNEGYRDGVYSNFSSYLDD